MMMEILKNKKAGSYIGMVVGVVIMFIIPMIFEVASRVLMVGFMVLIASTIVYVSERFKEEHITSDEALLIEKDERLILSNIKAYALAGKMTMGLVVLLILASQRIEIELSYVFLSLIFTYFQLYRTAYSYYIGHKVDTARNMVWTIIISLYYIASFVYEFNHFKALILVCVLAILSELIIKRVFN